MIGPAIIAWAVPLIVAVWAAWWRARHLIEGPWQYFRSIAIGTAFAAVIIYAVHMTWLAAVMMMTGGIGDLAFWAFYWTVITALLWGPVLVISFTILALKKRRAEGVGQ